MTTVLTKYERTKLVSILQRLVIQRNLPENTPDVIDKEVAKYLSGEQEMPPIALVRTLNFKTGDTQTVNISSLRMN